MDKMTHVKFNFNNFLMGFSVAFDKIFKNNIYEIPFNSQRISYIALRLSSYTNFTAEHFSDLSAYSLLYNLDISLEHLDALPFINKTIYRNSDMKNILKLSTFIENNMNIKHNRVMNKDNIIKEIEKSDWVTDRLKESFTDLSDDMTFWLDVTNDCQLPFYIYNFLQDFTIEIDYIRLIRLSEIINDIVYSHTNNQNKNTIGEKTQEMCQVYNLDNKDSARMIIASNLYCIGKLFIPKEIYYKSSVLTNEEIDTIKAIPYFSYFVLSSVYGFDDIAKLCSVYNERLDGTGSPYELEGVHLSLKERLLAILVIYQALMEKKVYREAFSYEEAIAILKKDGLENKIDLTIVEDVENKFKNQELL